MATYVNPFSWAEIKVDGELAHDFYVEAAQALLRLGVEMNPLDLGVITLQGVIGGADSDTLRVVDQTNLMNQALASLDSETDVPATVSHVMGYTDFSVDRVGLSREQTYEQQIFSGGMVVDALGIPAFLSAVPDMVAATLRSKYATAGSGITAVVGTTSALTSYDTLIALSAAFNSGGYSPLLPENPVLTLHPVQMDHVRASARVEPGFQQNGLATGIQGLNRSQYIVDPYGLGFDIALNPDVAISTGAYQGFATDRGGIGVCFGDTSRIAPAAGVQALALPQIGIHIQEISDGARQGIRAAQVRGWMGCSVGSSNVYRQSRCQGATS